MKKTAIITGADGGMGTEITRAVAMAGYHVIMLCYTAFRGEERRSQLILDTKNEDIEVMQVDLSSMDNIVEVAQRISAKETSVDLLMNNAGTMRTHFSQTEDGFEYTVAVNYLAPFLLTHRLLPLMHAGTRIVNMVSCTYAIGKIGPHFFTHGKEGSFWRIPIYSNTKLALWLFTCRLARKLKDKGITVNAADPGIVSTNIISMDMWFDPLTDVLFRPFIRTPRQGADTAIRLLLEPDLEGVTGQMFARKVPEPSAGRKRMDRYGKTSATFHDYRKERTGPERITPATDIPTSPRPIPDTNRWNEGFFRYLRHSDKSPEPSGPKYLIFGLFFIITRQVNFEPLEK